MAKHVRVLIVLMLAAFTIGTVVHTANATAMSMKMTLADTDGAGMGDCEDCLAGGDSMSLCDSVCVSPILALAPVLQGGLPMIKAKTASNVVYGVTGRAGPPDHYPPRSITLS